MNFTNWIFTFTGNIWYDAGINLYIFAVGFVLYAGLQTAIKQKQWGIVLPFAPIILHAAVIDVLFNQSGGRAMFLETRNTWTLSGRFDFHFYEEGWRGDRSRWWGNRINIVFPWHIGQRREV
jgi:hypothetical protein